MVDSATKKVAAKFVSGKKSIQKIPAASALSSPAAEHETDQVAMQNAHSGHKASTEKEKEKENSTDEPDEKQILYSRYDVLNVNQKLKSTHSPCK